MITCVTFTVGSTKLEGSFEGVLLKDQKAYHHIIPMPTTLVTTMFNPISHSSHKLTPNLHELAPNLHELTPNSHELAPNSHELTPNSHELAQQGSFEGVLRNS